MFTLIYVFLYVFIYPELPIQHGSSRSTISHRPLSDFLTLLFISHLSLTSVFTMLSLPINLYNLGY